MGPAFNIMNHMTGNLGVKAILAEEGMGEQDILDTMDSKTNDFGHVTHLRPVPQMEKTPPKFVMSSVPLGTHPAAWVTPSES